MARAAGHRRARLRLHLAPSPERLERHGRAAPGPCRPGLDGALGARSRCMGRGRRQLLGQGQAWRRADRTQSHGPRQARDQVPRVAVATDGLPLGAIPSAANVHDTRLFPHLLHLALAVCAAIAKLYADAGYDSTDNRRLCLDQGIQPYIRQIGEAHGSGPGRVRSVVEHDCAWLLANKRLDRRQDRLGHIILALLTAACIFIIANRISAF